jgi:hypothetical protein
MPINVSYRPAAGGDDVKTSAADVDQLAWWDAHAHAAARQPLIQRAG